MRHALLPTPPLDLLHRTGHMGDDDPVGAYDRMGNDLRCRIEAMLGEDWTWAGRRVLDFGCGAGRVLRQFVSEAESAEFWGCDIDRRSISWLEETMCPPFHVSSCSEVPGLDHPDGYFDLIYAISVYTHITDYWADWLLEHHRLLSDDGLLLVSFLGEGMSEDLIGEQWNEDQIGMNALLAGNSWAAGGPITLHSPWWLRAHWGRAFEIVSLKAHTGDDQPMGHGLILLRRRPVQVTREDLERLEPGEPREIAAVKHHVEQLRDETLLLRGDNVGLQQRLAASNDGQHLARLEQQLASQDALLAATHKSISWRMTSPLRAARRFLGRRSSL